MQSIQFEETGRNVSRVGLGGEGVGHVRTLASGMDRFDPLSEQEQQSIVQAFSQAGEQLAYYRGTL
ncbi:MAG: hypothetical protein ACOC24_01265 [Desulfovibrionales bacterium]